MNPADLKLHRGTFDMKYALDPQPWKKGGGFRLMDFAMFWRDIYHGETPAQPGPDEFAVFDMQKQQIGYFEWDKKFDSAKVQATIEGHFACHAHRVFDRLWVV